MCVFVFLLGSSNNQVVMLLFWGDIGIVIAFYLYYKNNKIKTLGLVWYMELTTNIPLFCFLVTDWFCTSVDLQVGQTLTVSPATALVCKPKN